MFFKIFNKKAMAPSTDFSRFFVTSKAAEKKRLLKKIAEKANEDQKVVYLSA